MTVSSAMPIRSPWEVDPDLVLVVACCEFTRAQARRFDLFHGKDGRSIRPAGFVAFYCGGQIDTVGEIAGPPDDGVIVSRHRDLASFAKVMPESGGDPDKSCMLLRLRNVRDIGPIINDKMSKSGKKTAWTQYQGYTTIQRLRKARRTTEL